MHWLTRVTACNKSGGGVVFKPVSNGYDWGLDMPATEALRAKVRSGQHA